MGGMKKALLALGAVLLSVVLLAGCASPSTARGAAERTRDLPQISVADALSQEEDVYAVYFWRSACPFCQQFEPTVVSYWNAGLPVFVVDMDHNAEAWYDGAGYTEDLMVHIGDVVDGELVLLDGHSLDDHPFEEGWETGADAEGRFWARLTAAAQMNIDITDSGDFAVHGTPSVVLVRDGRVINHGSGVPRAVALLDELAGLVGMPGQVLPDAG